MTGEEDNNAQVSDRRDLTFFLARFDIFRGEVKDEILFNFSILGTFGLF